MIDPIERVARAIFNHMFAEHERGKWDTDDWLRERYLDCARAAIAAMPAPWQPIETAKTDGRFILVGWAGNPVINRLHFYRGEWTNGQLEWEQPTHWMPLPEPPEISS